MIAEGNGPQLLVRRPARIMERHPVQICVPNVYQVGEVIPEALDIGELMRRMLRTALCLFPISLGPLFGQGPTLAGTGYSNPSIIRVAPGQITTLFLTGLKTVLSSQPVSATSLPLPATLAGISISLSQNGQQPSPIPLLSVQQIPICSNGDLLPPRSVVTPDCLITAVTVQIPFELLLPPEGATAELAVNENGNVSKGFRVLPVSVNLHVLNGCDAFPLERLNIAMAS